LKYRNNKVDVQVDKIEKDQIKNKQLEKAEVLLSGRTLT
jgi:hypothetical protein